MPIQVTANKFVQFVYDPDYLKTPWYKKTRTDSWAVCRHIGIDPSKSDLVVDGGNVIKGKDWVILTDKIFTENPGRTKHSVLAELENIFEAKPIIIPADPSDFTGHADGLVRYYTTDTVLVNAYDKNDQPAFQSTLIKALRKEGLKVIPVVYYPYTNSSPYSAVGVYMNFLQLQQLMFLPIFGISQDEFAYRLFDELFPGNQIVPIPSTEIARRGGVLNCITWNIRVSDASTIGVRLFPNHEFS